MKINKLIKHSSIITLAHQIKNGNLRPTELVEYYLTAIRQFNPQLKSFITVLERESVQEAETLENELKRGIYRGILHGIPYSVKDIIAIKNVRLTAGSRILSTNISKFDSTIIKRLKKAGSILLGTNNLNEFAAGITGKNIFYGDTKNPLALTRIAGGSSGGSAAAVGAGLITFALGTDTGGSIRVPSSLCGTFGFKPTFGCISTTGILKLAPSLDHLGIIGRTSVDLSIVFTTIRKARIKFTDYMIDFERHNFSISNLKRVLLKKNLVIKIIIPNNYFLDYLEPGVESSFNSFINLLKTDKSHSFSYVQADPKYFFESWMTVRLFEAYIVHKKNLNKKINLYSQELKDQLIEGSKIKLEEYKDALSTITKIRLQFLDIFDKFEFMILPTTIISAPLLSECSIRIKDKIFSVRDSLLKNTSIFNSIGFPSLTIPFGVSHPSKMPVGIQIVSKPYDDYKLLMFGDYIEKQYLDSNKQNYQVYE